MLLPVKFRGHPGGDGYGFGCCAGRSCDSFEGLAARHPAMTRPLFERRDMIAGPVWERPAENVSARC
jgi:hypothetical protein